MYVTMQTRAVGYYLPLFTEPTVIYTINMKVMKNWHTVNKAYHHNRLKGATIVQFLTILPYQNICP